jgi:hypothetical protein
VQAQLRQRETELQQANAELEERGKLLYKTKASMHSCAFVRLRTKAILQAARRSPAKGACADDIRTPAVPPAHGSPAQWMACTDLHADVLAGGN